MANLSEDEIHEMYAKGYKKCKEDLFPYLHHQFGCKFEPMESPCTCGLDNFVECK